MNFIFQMARRELRTAWRRLLFFFLSIAIGVGCIVAVRSMMQNANSAIALQARALLTDDPGAWAHADVFPGIIGVGTAAAAAG